MTSPFPTSQPPAHAPEVPIIVYSTTWCADCHRAMRHLDRWGVVYTLVNIEEVDGAAEQVMAWAGGRRVVPTIVIGDRVLVNPHMRELAHAVGADW